MKPRPIAFFLLISGVVFGLAALGLVTVATHLHAPSTSILRTPELESMIKDDVKLSQKLRDEENAAGQKILTIVGAHFQACILLAAAGGCQIVAGLALLSGEKKRIRSLP